MKAGDKRPLHRIIEERIQARVAAMSPGERLATEHELCKEFGVSRHVVNKVLCRLTEQGLLYRVRRRGTFVSERQPSSKRVTMLLPGPDVLSSRHDERFFLQEIVRGLVETGHRLGLTVSMLVSTSDHRRESLDPAPFSGLTRNDKLLVASMWWAPVFEAIEARGCDIIYMGAQSGVEGAPDFRDNRFKLALDTIGNVEQLVTHFCRQGRRRILCPQLDNDYGFTDPVVLGYRQGLEQNGLKLQSELMPPFSFSYHMQAMRRGQVTVFRDMIRKARAAAPFDAMIVPCGVFSRIFLQALTAEGLHVPDDVALAATSETPELAKLEPSVSSMVTHYHEFGAEAARLFARPLFTPGEKLFTGEFHQRASSSVHGQPSAAVEGPTDVEAPATHEFMMF